MRKLLLFRIVLYGTAVGLIALYFFGREGGDSAQAAGNELSGETSQRLPMRMYVDDEEVTSFEMDLDFRCPNGRASQTWWNPSPGWAAFHHSGGTFTAEERTHHSDQGYTVDGIYTMRADVGGSEASGVARVIFRYAYADGTRHVCQSGDVRFALER